MRKLRQADAILIARGAGGAEGLPTVLRSRWGSGYAGEPAPVAKFRGTAAMHAWFRRAVRMVARWAGVVIVVPWWNVFAGIASPTGSSGRWHGV
jgi:hypothetical protein